MRGSKVGTERVYPREIMLAEGGTVVAATLSATARSRMPMMMVGTEPLQSSDTFTMVVPGQLSVRASRGRNLLAVSVPAKPAGRDAQSTPMESSVGHGLSVNAPVKDKRRSERRSVRPVRVGIPVISALAAEV